MEAVTLVSLQRKRLNLRLWKHQRSLQWRNQLLHEIHEFNFEILVFCSLFVRSRLIRVARSAFCSFNNNSSRGFTPHGMLTKGISHCVSFVFHSQVRCLDCIEVISNVTYFWIPLKVKGRGCGLVDDLLTTFMLARSM